MPVRFVFRRDLPPGFAFPFSPEPPRLTEKRNNKYESPRLRVSVAKFHWVITSILNGSIGTHLHQDGDNWIFGVLAAGKFRSRLDCALLTPSPCTSWVTYTLS